MFSLTIIFGTSPNPWVLLFKTKEAAEAAMDAYRVNGKTTTWEGSDFPVNAPHASRDGAIRA